jgi:hypothetical protein
VGQEIREKTGMDLPTQIQIQAMVRVLAYLSIACPHISLARAKPIIRAAIDSAGVPADAEHPCSQAPWKTLGTRRPQGHRVSPC